MDSSYFSSFHTWNGPNHVIPGQTWLFMCEMIQRILEMPVPNQRMDGNFLSAKPQNKCYSQVHMLPVALGGCYVKSIAVSHF